MEDIGEIIEATDNRIKIQIERNSSCKRCGLCIVSEDQKKMFIELDNKIGASTGDRVRLSVPEGVVVTASLIVYMLPLTGFIGAIILGQKYFPENQSIVLAAGFVGLFVAFAVSKWLDYYVQKKQKMNLSVEKI